MKKTLQIKMLFQKEDGLFLLFYIGYLMFMPNTINISSIDFIRGYDFLDPMITPYTDLIFWGITMLIPIFYLLLRFSHYFECSQYYFIRIVHRQSWLRLFLMRAMMILTITLLIKSIYIIIHLHIPFTFSFHTFMILLRDILYYFTLFEIYLWMLLYLKRGVVYLLPTFIYLFIICMTTPLQNFLLLDAYHWIEILIYFVMIMILYKAIAYRLDHDLEKINVV